MSYQNTWGWNHEIWTQKTQRSIAPPAVMIAMPHTNHMEICLLLQMEYNISKYVAPRGKEMEHVQSIFAII
jgi:hypothetical protein